MRGSPPASRTLSALALAGLLGGMAGGCAAGEASADRPATAERCREISRPPARPRGCRELAPGVALQAALDVAPEGSALCLGAGEYPGPVRLARGVTLWGPRAAVLRSSGEGTTVRLEADGAALLGVTVDGSGGRYDLLDAAVHVQARGARVQGVRVRGAVFGILVEKSREVAVLDNEVSGDAAQPLGLRGDGIRLWETQDSRLEGNRVLDSRDVVIWYSSGNAIRENCVVRSRYGTHLMYSHANLIESNRYLENVTGVFLMYSRNVTLRSNLIAKSAGAAGLGLGLKESGDIRAEGNYFIGNTVGIYSDTSPLYEGEQNHYAQNVFRFSEAAVVFHSSAERNSFEANSFRENAESVRVEGRGDARAVSWSGNDWDAYAGYDLDGDGVGDVPFELRSLSGELTRQHPSLAFFRGTAALRLADQIGRLVPLFAPRLLLVDPAPRMRPPDPRAPDAG